MKILRIAVQCVMVLMLFSNALLAQENPTEYSLNKLVNSAIENNYLLKAGENNDLISKSELEQLETTYLPKISMSASYSYWRWLTPNKEKILGGGHTYQFTEISAYQTIYDWGENDVRKLMINRDIELNDEAQRQIRQTIIFGVSSEYVELQKIKIQSEIYLHSISQLKSQLQFTQNLYEIGKASEVDMLRVKVKISTEEDKLQQTLNAEQAQITRLRNLCFIDKNEGFNTDTLAAVIAGQWINASLYADSIYNNIANNHPSLRSSVIKMDLETQQKELYRLENRPELYSYAATTWEDNYIPFTNNFNYYIGVGVRYTLPYLGGRGHETRMQQSDFRVYILEEKHKQQYLELKSEIDLVLNEWKNTQDKLESLAQTIELAEKALQNASVLYQSGQGSLIDVLDAQTVLTTSQIDYKRNSLELLQILARIQYLSGSDNIPFNI